MMTSDTPGAKRKRKFISRDSLTYLQRVVSLTASMQKSVPSWQLVAALLDSEHRKASFVMQQLTMFGSQILAC